MKRSLMAAAAVGGLLLSPALAQAPSNMNNPDKPSAAQSTTTTTTTTTGAQAISQQRQDQWLFSKFNGTDVIGADDAKIGDVSDVLFDKTGKVDALIVGVGGFLGIGSKDVALPVTAFQVVPGSNGGADKLRLSMTKDQLTQMAEFKPLASSTTTTGAGSTGTTSRPASPAR